MWNLSSRLSGFPARVILLIAILVMGTGEAWAQSLSERSPFLPPDFNKPSSNDAAPAVQPTSLQHLRLKGVFSLNGKVKVNLFNTQTNKGIWVPIDGMIDGHRVVAYNAQDRSVDIEVDGTVTRFEMIQASDSPIPVATAPTTTAATRPAVRRNVRPGTTGSSTVRRRTIVPPRPRSRSTTRSSNSRTNRRTVVIPGQTQSQSSSATQNSSANSRNGRPTTPRQPRQLPQ